MFDIWLRRQIDPVLNRMAASVAKAGMSANQLTIIGVAIGVGAATAIATGNFAAGLFLIAANRLFDGLDGAVARVSGATEWGGYLDILADYAFYVAVPIGFAIAIPGTGLAIALLASSFVLTAVSFLALAAILAGQDKGHGKKSFTYTTGLIEGGETIGAFILMCLLPQHAGTIALIVAVLCGLTALQRLWLARTLLR